MSNNLFVSIQTSFNIFDKRKTRLLVCAGDKFRKFKNELYTKYIKDQSCDRIHPKVKRLYPNIKKDDWRAFVGHCNTLEFKKLSMEQNARRKKYEYDHHLGRKGYGSFAKELVMN